jgi:hypothetical protein
MLPTNMGSTLRYYRVINRQVPWLTIFGGLGTLVWDEDSGYTQVTPTFRFRRTGVRLGR